MHTSVVMLRPGNILDIAKGVVRPSGWNCEWNISSPKPCKIMLSSWDSYMKHLLEHSRQQSKRNTFICCLPRCNIPAGLTINSYNDLVVHIQQSHLNRVHLYCPVKDCASRRVSRPALLEGHFMDSHPDLVNQDITLPSDILLPLWRPYFPPSRDPPPLPTAVAPGSILVSNVEGTGTGQPRAKTPHPPDKGNERITLGSPKKRPKLTPGGDENPLREYPMLIFEDLPKQLNPQGDYINTADIDCVIRGKGPHIDVARPQPQLDPVHKTPKLSILYAAFAEKMEYDELKRSRQQNVSSSIAGPSGVSKSAN